jgi:hypothetical protein
VCVCVCVCVCLCVCVKNVTTLTKSDGRHLGDGDLEVPGMLL